MASYDHTELLELVATLVNEHDEAYLHECIRQCHNGVLRGPINPGNLHLFRRYRNDPVGGSGDPQVMIDEAMRRT